MVGSGTRHRAVASHAIFEPGIDRRWDKQGIDERAAVGSAENDRLMRIEGAARRVLNAGDDVVRDAPTLEFGSALD